MLIRASPVISERIWKIYWRCSHNIILFEKFLLITNFHCLVGVNQKQRKSTSEVVHKAIWKWAKSLLDIQLQFHIMVFLWGNCTILCKTTITTNILTYTTGFSALEDLDLVCLNLFRLLINIWILSGERRTTQPSCSWKKLARTTISLESLSTSRLILSWPWCRASTTLPLHPSYT